MGRKVRTVEASGTIRRQTYDALGRGLNSLVGTNDTGLEGSTMSGTENMVITHLVEYDDGNDGGNGLVTERTARVVDGTTNQRVTNYEYDYRGNLLLQTNPTAPHTLHEYDSAGRRTATGQYSSTASIVVGTDKPTTEATNRLALSESKYDVLGRVYQSIRHKIDAADGSTDDTLESTTWRDARGRVVKTDGSSLTKTLYDGLGRTTHSFTLAVDDDTTYAHVDDVSGDIVLVESQSVYEADSNNVLLRVRIDRLHDDKGAGETTGALDSNADGDDLLLTAANVEGRCQITAMWYDDRDRVTDTVRYGTNGGSNCDRDGLSVPTRSGTKLRSTSTYADDGSVEEIEDPRGLVRRTKRDDAGRTTKTIRNYDASVNSGDPSGTDDNVTVKYEYTDGLRTKIIADLPSGSTDQETIYTYGTVGGGDAGDSEIPTGHLLQEVEYPDSTGPTDVVSYAYNAQGQQIYKKDQAGNVIETSFDVAGRQTDRDVTTIDGDFDNDILKVTTTYDDLGRRDEVVQYDAVTSGTAQDGVKYSYDGWGNIITFEGDRDSAVAASAGNEYEVSYTWEKETAGRNTVRLDEMTLPSGAVVAYSYRTIAGRHDSDVSRVTYMTHKDSPGGTPAIVASYQYSGLGQVVESMYNEIDVVRERFGSTSGVYDAWDEFGRVVEDVWKCTAATSTDFYSIDISYDENSNITLIEDNVHSGFDVEYTMDNIDRLTRAEEGTWSGSAISSRSRDQQWELDQVGNWDRDKVDLNGDGDFTDTDELDDTRTHNDVNELTARDPDSTPGTGNYGLVYDEAGNMTSDGHEYAYEYDAFYRLRTVKTPASQLVAEYRYNGLGHRIAEHVDTDDDGDVDGSDDWKYFAYDQRWRQVAMFVGSATDPKTEHLHHAAGMDGRGGSSYIDEFVMRERDANDDGSLDERLYYCQNWRADVSAIVNDSHELVEWVKYSAYGVPFGLPMGDVDSDGDCDSTDVTAIQALIDPTYQYDVRGDVDLNGTLSAADKSAVVSRFQGTTLGRGGLSAVANRRGTAGYVYDSVVSEYLVRNRVLHPELGWWLQRDSAGYVAGSSLHHSMRASPASYLDPMGLQATLVQGGSQGHVDSEPQDPFDPPIPAGDGCAGCDHGEFNEDDFKQGYLKRNADGSWSPTGSGYLSCNMAVTVKSSEDAVVQDDGDCYISPFLGDLTPCSASACSATLTATVYSDCPVSKGVGFSGPVDIHNGELGELEDIPKGGVEMIVAGRAPCGGAALLTIGVIAVDSTGKIGGYMVGAKVTCSECTEVQQ